MCKTPNICLLKSCVGHHLMIGCNRCVAEAIGLILVKISLCVKYCVTLMTL